MRWSPGRFILLAFALVAPSFSPPVAAQTPAVIRIALSDTDLSAEPLYAQETGIFARHGITAQFSPSEAGGAGVIREIKAGTIDMGFSNLISIAGSVQRGEPVVLIAPAGIHNKDAPINAIVQAPGTDFTSGKELDGKRISSPSGPGSAGALAPAAWIDLHGGDSKSVQFVTGIKPFDIPAAFAAHRIDAAEMGDPDLTILLRRHAVKMLCSPFDAIGNHYLLAGFVASKAWVQANPDVARRFVLAMRETAVWANAHRAQTATILTRSLKLDPAVVKVMSRTLYAERITPAIMQPPLDVAAKYGVLKPMNAADLLIEETK